MSNNTHEPKAKRRLLFVEDLDVQVKQLERTNAQLTSAATELRDALRELVEACEAGGTSRYISAVGRARRLLDTADLTGR